MRNSFAFKWHRHSCLCAFADGLHTITSTQSQSLSSHPEVLNQALLSTRFKHNIERRLRRPPHPWKPAAFKIFESRPSPACALSANPTSCENEAGVHAPQW